MWWWDKNFLYIFPSIIKIFRPFWKKRLINIDSTTRYLLFIILGKSLRSWCHHELISAILCCSGYPYIPSCMFIECQVLSRRCDQYCLPLYCLKLPSSHFSLLKINYCNSASIELCFYCLFYFEVFENMNINRWSKIYRKLKKKLNHSEKL